MNKIMKIHGHELKSERKAIEVFTGEDYVLTFLKPYAGELSLNPENVVVIYEDAHNETSISVLTWSGVVNKYSWNWQLKAEIENIKAALLTI